MRKLSESEQAALFLEFLRWKEQQSATNSNASPVIAGDDHPIVLPDLVDHERLD
jgi:hypothetical protein